ncbi:ribonuclease III [Methyloversatilis sp.]|uniref:ribonuclease III n=1 Tax=Methyloversatilis sp. TaxID=2569862 RepID=UPI0035B4AD1E
MSDDAQIEQALGHAFASRTLLAQALTHSSFSSSHNERLELLGDAVLDCVATELLFRRFPDVPEGLLSRLRASLVKEDTLAEIAAAISVGDALRLSAGERKTGGGSRPALLANALEALIGAVFLEAGYDAARAVVARLLDSRLAALDPDRDARDPKTALQEWLHARAKRPPRYEIASTTGPAHAPVFCAACIVDAFDLRTEGEGRSRRHAEQAAATRALEQLQGQS